MEYINYNIRKIFFPLAVTCFVVLLMSGCNKKETYTVTFDANGGTGTMQPQTFVEDEPQALRLNEFICDNCTFSYWSPLKQHVFSTPESPKNEYRDGETITVYADMTLYAHWASNGTNPSPDPSPTPGPTPSNTVTVTYNANGGTGEMAPQTFTIGTAQSLTRNAFTYYGYTFTGWNTVQGGSGASYTDGQTIIATADMTLFAQWISNGTNPTPEPDPTPTPFTGTLNGHEWVDLGLPSGLLWATTNVGAENPEDYGNYYAWGETFPKATYNWNTYRYCMYNGYLNNILTKYCRSSGWGYNGFTDALTTLEVTDDAATVNWGTGWKMPTKEDMNELYNSCTNEWTTQNGVNGRKFTGPNGNSIFLPAAGYLIDDELHSAGSIGDYWLSSLYSGYSYDAWILYLDSGNCRMGNGIRCDGHSVRPVCMLIENN